MQDRKKESDPDPDRKPTKKWDPDTDLKKIISDPQHCIRVKKKPPDTNIM
jgi:hypothetical protein